MRRAFPQSLALAVGLAAVMSVIGSQPARGAAARLREGQRVALVGQITSAPKEVAGVRAERKMQVAIGPGKVDYTLHMSDAEVLGLNGQKIETDDLTDKQWVRAEGTVMDDPRRIRVTRVQVIGTDAASMRSSPYFRADHERGYLAVVAGSRETLIPEPARGFGAARVVIVGKVSSDTGTLETTRNIQVDAAGTTWTLNVPREIAVFDVKGEKISVHEIKRGQWIQAQGWEIGDRRVRATRLQNIGTDEAFRASTFFRAGEPSGYVERSTGTRSSAPTRRGTQPASR